MTSYYGNRIFKNGIMQNGYLKYDIGLPFCHPVVD